MINVTLNKIKDDALKAKGGDANIACESVWVALDPYQMDGIEICEEPPGVVNVVMHTAKGKETIATTMIQES